MDQTGDSTSAHDPGLLAAYVEGRLDDEERRALTAHLAACAHCREALAMLARAPGIATAAAPRRPIGAPVWLAVAATVVLATVVARRTDRTVEGPVSGPGSTVSGVTAPSLAPPAPSPAEPAPPAAFPAHDPLQDPALLVKRGVAQRQVDGKTFRLRAGEWVDTAFRSTASLPTVLVTGPGERAAIVRRIPALAPYAALGDRVVVVLDGTVYRFAP